MGKINWGRVVMGGLVAGVVLNVWDWVINGMLLKSDWDAAMQALGKTEMGGSMIVWFVICDFLIGLFLVWLYAAIRPRYGAGPKTALCAGLGAWFLLLASELSGMGMGLFPSKLMWMAAVAALIGVPLAALAGGYLYKEEAAA